MKKIIPKTKIKKIEIRPLIDNFFIPDNTVWNYYWYWYSKIYWKYDYWQQIIKSYQQLNDIYISWYEHNNDLIETLNQWSYYLIITNNWLYKFNWITLTEEIVSTNSLIWHKTIKTFKKWSPTGNSYTISTINKNIIKVNETITEDLRNKIIEINSNHNFFVLWNTENEIIVADNLEPYNFQAWQTILSYNNDWLYYFINTENWRKIIESDTPVTRAEWPNFQIYHHNCLELYNKFFYVDYNNKTIIRRTKTFMNEFSVEENKLILPEEINKIYKIADKIIAVSKNKFYILYFDKITQKLWIQYIYDIKWTITNTIQIGSLLYYIKNWKELWFLNPYYIFWRNDYNMKEQNLWSNFQFQNFDYFKIIWKLQDRFLVLKNIENWNLYLYDLYKHFFIDYYKKDYFIKNWIEIDFIEEIDGKYLITNTCIKKYKNYYEPIEIETNLIHLDWKIQYIEIISFWSYNLEPLITEIDIDLGDWYKTYKLSKSINKQTYLFKILKSIKKLRNQIRIKFKIWNKAILNHPATFVTLNIYYI